MKKTSKSRGLRRAASTITQQLAKNLFLSPSRNPMRKIKEAVLAWRMERALSKRRILELYMNYAEWGPGIFGIEAASRHYYGIPASALNAEQAAKLATVLPNPNIYSPVKPDRYVQRRSAIIYPPDPPDGSDSRESTLPRVLKVPSFYSFGLSFGVLSPISQRLAQQLRHLHPAQRFEQRRNLRRDLRHIACDLMHPRRRAVAGRNNGDFVDYSRSRRRAALPLRSRR